MNRVKSNKYSTKHKNSNNTQQHTTTFKNIRPEILKPSSEATVNILHKLFNETVTKDVFSDTLKPADITPLFKKDNPFVKKTTDLSVFYRLYLKFRKTNAKANK